ncbi:MAG: mechanosensitive ion channel family protein [Cytophagales bacterium]|nr:MAG: mechanosensitive ion channel family protein [Cytophagales bacterium]
MDFSKISSLVGTYLTVYGGKVLLAILTLIIGLWVIGQVVRLLGRIMNSRHIDRDVQPFLLSMVSGLLRVLLLLSVAGMLGIETTSFVAIIGAAGLAVGLALQGSLSNFAGGVLILIFKPFRVGDLINAQGFTGNVEAIQIFNTILNTLDNKTIILPNGPLSTSPITNISGKGSIRVDMTFAAGNQNDLDKTMNALRQVVSACPTASKNKAHDVLVNHVSADAIMFDVRVWCHPDQYWDTYYFMQENVVRQFGKDGIKGAENVQLVVNS